MTPCTNCDSVEHTAKSYGLVRLCAGCAIACVLDPEAMKKLREKRLDPLGEAFRAGLRGAPWAGGYR